MIIEVLVQYGDSLFFVYIGQKRGWINNENQLKLMKCLDSPFQLQAWPCHFKFFSSNVVHHAEYRDPLRLDGFYLSTRKCYELKWVNPIKMSDKKKTDGHNWDSSANDVKYCPREVLGMAWLIHYLTQMSAMQEEARKKTYYSKLFWCFSLPKPEVSIITSRNHITSITAELDTEHPVYQR